MNTVVKNNLLVVTPNEGYLLALKGSTTNNFYHSLMLPEDYDINKIIEVINNNIPVYVPEYTPDTYGMSMDKLQQYIISQTKILLEEFLKSNPLEYTDGKLYNVSSDAQAHLLSIIKAGETAEDLDMDFTPMWNSVDESRRPYSLIELKKLFIAIQNYVLPFIIQQQNLETKILSFTNKEDLLNLSIAYYKDNKEETK